MIVARDVHAFPVHVFSHFHACGVAALHRNFTLCTNTFQLRKSRNASAHPRRQTCHFKVILKQASQYLLEDCARGLAFIAVMVSSSQSLDTRSISDLVLSLGVKLAEL